MLLDVQGRQVRAATGGRDLDAHRPLLILLHGAGMDHTVWSLVMRALAHRGYSVLAPDLPGHGKSAGPAPSSVDDYAAWTVALIEATGCASAHLAGHSLGSAIALQTAANRPDLVDSLILMGTAAAMPVHPELQAAADAGDHKAIDLIMSWALAPSAHLGRHPAPGMAMRSAGMRLMESVDAAVLASDLRASANYADAITAATAVTCPAILILGQQDQMTPPRNAAPLATALGNGHTVTLPGVGHMMMLENPDVVIDRVVSFLGSVTPSG